MIDASIACPTCGDTQWFTYERGQYKKEVLFETDEPNMTVALDFSDYLEEDTDESAPEPKFDGKWWCSATEHPAPASVNELINQLLESKDAEEA